MYEISGSQFLRITFEISTEAYGKSIVAVAFITVLKVQKYAISK